MIYGPETCCAAGLAHRTRVHDDARDCWPHRRLRLAPQHRLCRAGRSACMQPVRLVRVFYVCRGNEKGFR